MPEQVEQATVNFSLEDDAVHGSNQLRAAIASRKRGNDGWRAGLNYEKSKVTTTFLAPRLEAHGPTRDRHEASTNPRYVGLAP